MESRNNARHLAKVGDPGVEQLADGIACPVLAVRARHLTEQPGRCREPRGIAPDLREQRSSPRVDIRRELARTMVEVAALASREGPPAAVDAPRCNLGQAR